MGDTGSLLIRAERSMLLAVDLQQRLVPAIDDGEGVVRRTAWLVRAAQKIGVPVAATEQYPQGLGPTATLLADLLPAGSIGTKVHFSCAEADCLGTLPGANRPQVVIAGVEAHVCVLQTALGLVGQDRQVFVVEDATGSRRAADKALALERMRQHGVTIVSKEMVVFEWLARAGTPLFRDVSREFLR